MAGATLLVNRTASNATAGNADYRHVLVGSQSTGCMAACLYSSAGLGEATTDMALGSQALVFENGQMLAESERFCDRSQLITANGDL